jgi:hypothetical protein
MVSPKDVYISAQLLIKQHGNKAEDIAAQKMQELMDKDDVKGASVWLSISQAIENLRTVKSQGKLN